jgi:hypothetical protein
MAWSPVQKERERWEDGAEYEEVRDAQKQALGPEQD